MSFTNAHIPSPACAPSRVAIMTGVSPARSGITGWRNPKWREVPALKDVVTLEQFFKEKGYQTLAGGKIYHSLAPPRTMINESEEKGWDYYYPSFRIPIPISPRAPDSLISPKNFKGVQPEYFTWGPINQGDDYMADYQLLNGLSTNFPKIMTNHCFSL
jgi:arylsulfatase A-like enzyme